MGGDDQVNKLDEASLHAQVEAVLLAARTGKGPGRKYLNAYQILAQLPAATRRALVEHYSRAGIGSGRYFSAASKVAKVADKVENRKKSYVDTRNMAIVIDDEIVRPSYPVCAVFKVP